MNGNSLLRIRRLSLVDLSIFALFSKQNRLSHINIAPRRPNHQITVGAKANFVKHFSEKDVAQFAEISEDRNPLHIDENFAKSTRYGRCIVHGVLINGLTSAVMGMKLPGHGSIFMSQQITFHAPLFVGEPMKAEVEIVNIEGKKVTCSLTCTAVEREKVIMSGFAQVLVPRLKATKSSSSKF